VLVEHGDVDAPCHGSDGDIHLATVVRPGRWGRQTRPPTSMPTSRGGPGAGRQPL